MIEKNLRGEEKYRGLFRHAFCLRLKRGWESGGPVSSHFVEGGMGKVISPIWQGRKNLFEEGIQRDFPVPTPKAWGRGYSNT